MKTRQKGQTMIELGFTMFWFVFLIVSFCWIAIWGSAYVSARFVTNEAERGGTISGGSTAQAAAGAGMSAVQKTALVNMATSTYLPASTCDWTNLPASACPSWTGALPGTTSCPNITTPVQGVWICAQAILPCEVGGSVTRCGGQTSLNTGNNCMIAVEVAGWINVGIPIFGGLMPFNFQEIQQHQATSSNSNPGNSPYPCS